jgi:hypothetical protein
LDLTCIANVVELEAVDGICASSANADDLDLQTIGGALLG